ncbi:right-handed parallel beta-helix repeat-containing protein [Methanobrevibacter sp.]|uniref:right-handed parallel beta-helix repeat-containing protein n=1 Tax=Methanobrevibacter sp. TaxID=66852 RepID=UPI00386D3A81
MGFKKASLVLLLLIILTMGAASAADTNTTSDNLAATEDKTLELSENDDFEDKLGIESSNHISDTGNSTGKLADLENVMSLTKDNHKEDKSYDDILSAQNDLNVLNTNYGTYSGLTTEIGSGGNIELNCDYYTYDSGDTITISTPNSVINGKGAIIDMAGSSSMRAFEVTASDVTIKNLTIKNANYNGNGGAIYFSNSGTVTNCNFTNNTAQNGGAIYFYGTGAVTNCNFTNNTAQNGGAAFWHGKGTMTNCTFINNSGHEGGAVYIWSNVNLVNCNFTNNKATGYYGEGGAISMGLGTVSNCNFVNNTATGTDSWGGAVSIVEGTVTNCNFTNNTAKVGNAVAFSGTGIISDCDFTNNPLSKGAIYSQTGDIDLSNNIMDVIEGNNFTTIQKLIDNANIGDTIIIDGLYAGFGISIRIDKPNLTLLGHDYATLDAKELSNILYITANNVTIKNILFKNGHGIDSAVYIHSDGTITNCTFINNSGHEGGAVFSDNFGSVENCNFVNNTATIWGGAVYFIDAGNVTNCNFTDNNATKYGGAVYIYSDGTITNCTFTNNSASESGGAIYIPTDSYGTVTNCNFTNNTANSEGGAIFFYSDSKGNVTNCNFIKCSAELGKAIYANNNTIISNCNFETQCSESLDELVIGGITSNCTINGNKEKTLTNMTVTVDDITYGENATFTVTLPSDATGTINITVDNKVMFTADVGNEPIIAEISGLDIGTYIANITYTGDLKYLPANASKTFTVSSKGNNTFTDLKNLIDSSSPGDTIKLEDDYINDGSITADGIAISKAITIDGKGHTLDGKGLSRIFKVNAENVTLKNIIFKNGHGNNGGAIQWMNTKGVADNCTFINCSAENGGSVYWNGENGMINKSTFDHSTATSNGGAIYWNANSGEIANSIFTNSYAQNGGAVYVPENRNVEIKSSIFDSNIAEEESGAVYGGTVDDDCTFKNNTYTPLNSTTIISINETAVYTGNEISITTLILSQKGGLVNTGTVEIYINSKLIATIPANTAYIYKTGDVGTYQVLAKFIDDSSYKDSSSTAEFTVIPVDIPEEIETSTAGIFTLEFPDDAEGTLTVFIDGTKYKVYDIIGGILKIDLSDKKGKYNITFEYSGDKNYPAFKKDANVTVETNPSITASNAKVLYSAGTTYKITVYKNKGITANSVSVVIKQNNKKFKTIKTNSKGVASFKVTQTPGTYKLKITSLGKTVTKTLTVKHIVTLKAVKVKKSAKKLILQATLAKVNKKYLKKKTVTFKFNGKTYKAKTNAKGIAEVTIKSNVLKKLKVGKKITYQATYLKDTVKKTVKVKK